MRLYFKYFNIHMKSDLQYKASFTCSFISNFLVFFGYYFTIICLFDKFSNIGGFTLYEVLLAFGVMQFGFSFCEIFFRGVDHFDELICRGDFDRLLLRPVGIIHQILCEEIDLSKLARLIQAIIIIIIAVIKLGIALDISKIIILLFMLISAVILYLCIFIIAAAYCFYTIKGLEARNVLLYGSREAAQYPIGVFGKKIVFFFTYILPFGLVNYYPLLYLVGRSNNKLFMICPMIALVYIIPSLLIFYHGMKKYKSVGS